MCTVTWLQHPHGYTLLCNRDERYTRLPAHAPRVKTRRGMQLIAPVDGDYGGTWIGVNSDGMALCLLNRYGDQPQRLPHTPISRGLLVEALLDCSTQADLLMRLSMVDLGVFQPWTLLALQPRAAATVIDWTGARLLFDREADNRMPLVSSSFDGRGVEVARRRLFERMKQEMGGVDVALLERFHRSHEPERGPYSVCMHRDNAATVSMSMITVTSSQVTFAYHTSAPDKHSPAHITQIERTPRHNRKPVSLAGAVGL